MERRIALVGVGGVLAWLVACDGGQSGTEKPAGDGGCDDEPIPVEDPEAPAPGLGFAIGPVVAPIGGGFEGVLDAGAGPAPVELVVTVGEGIRAVGGDCPRYQVPLRVEIRAPDAGVDAGFDAVAEVPDPESVLVQARLDPEDTDTTLWDPEMEGWDRLVYDFGLRFEGPGWAGSIGWSGSRSGTDGTASAARGELATFEAE